MGKYVYKGGEVSHRVSSCHLDGEATALICFIKMVYYARAVVLSDLVTCITEKTTLPLLQLNESCILRRLLCQCLCSLQLVFWE